jgi:hypothetical protein
MSASLLCMLRLSGAAASHEVHAARSEPSHSRTFTRPARKQQHTQHQVPPRRDLEDAAAPEESGRIASLRDARAGRSSEEGGTAAGQTPHRSRARARAARVGQPCLRCAASGVLRCRRAAVVLADSVAARLALALAGAGARTRAACLRVCRLLSNGRRARRPTRTAWAAAAEARQAPGEMQRSSKASMHLAPPRLLCGTAAAERSLAAAVLPAPPAPRGATCLSVAHAARASSTPLSTLPHPHRTPRSRGPPRRRSTRFAAALRCTPLARASLCITHLAAAASPLLP